MTSVSLNQLQKDTLARVASGNQPVTSREHSLATTVYALRRRGLVLTVGPRRNWVAEITDAGHRWLEHGPPRRERKSATKRTGTVDVTELLASITAAEGELTVTDPSPEQRAAYRSAIWKLRKEGLVPAGFDLTYSGRGGGDLVFRLRPATIKTEGKSAIPVPVPARLTKPHPTVTATRNALNSAGSDGAGRRSSRGVRGALDVRVSKAQLGRALRLQQALVAEAERRGYVIQEKDTPAIAIGEHAYVVSVTELLDRYPHVPTAAETREAERYSWTRIPEYDSAPSGRLKIELGNSYSGRRSTWTDGKRGLLEEKLGQVLAEIEARAVLDEQRRQDRLEQERCQEVQRQERLAAARGVMRTETLATELRRQSADWHEAAALRRYCEALDEALGDDVSTATRDWVTWARAYAEALDPLSGSSLPGRPLVPEVHDWQVETWMRGHGSG